MPSSDTRFIFLFFASFWHPYIILHWYFIFFLVQIQVTTEDDEEEEEELEKLRRLQKYRLQNFRYFFGKAVYEEDDIEEETDRLGVSTNGFLYVYIRCVWILMK